MVGVLCCFYFMNRLASLLYLALNVHIFSCSCEKVDDEISDDAVTYFPRTIRHYRVRNDPVDKTLPVSRGRLQLLPANASFDVFRRVLQCARHEPALDKFSFFKKFPMRRETLQLVATWFEKGCKTWRECNIVLQRHKQGVDNIKKNTNFFFMRISGGQIYYDWPFQSDEPEEQNIHRFHPRLFNDVVGRISDLGDGLVLYGIPHPEVSSVPAHFAFPVFCQSVAQIHGDILWPWAANVESEWRRYQAAFVDFKNNSYNEDILLADDPVRWDQWQKRRSKAVVVGAISVGRQPAFTIAALHSDLFTSGWYATNTIAGMEREIKAWDPASMEEDLTIVRNPDGTLNVSFPPQLSASNATRQQYGSIAALQLNFISDPIKGRLRVEYDHSHKYILVMKGSHGLASSDRLAELLSYSGAVILLQESEYESHFSRRLIPWVHFVPVLASMTDLVAKVSWLQRHDTLAFRLATNARNFGLSYLRLEDTLCYAALALRKVAELFNDTDAMIPFHPVKPA